MQQMMKCMDVALYHGVLPNRRYYLLNGKTHYLQVEHGLYNLPEADEELLTLLKQDTQPFSHLFGIIGHIRAEKNYERMMEVLCDHPSYGLIIAGSAANCGVNISLLKSKAVTLGISNQIIWIDRFLNESEMTAVISQCQTIVLYYASSFHSQSGILNQVATLKKPVIVSDLPNALTQTVRQYGLGYICRADDTTALKAVIDRIETTPLTPNWEKYFEAADWNRQADRVIQYLLSPAKP